MGRHKKSAQVAPSTSVPRKPTDEEWASYSEDFPRLTLANCWVTCPEVYDGYNCIGWSIGDTSLEHDVGPVEEMKRFYKGKGYHETEALDANADIDLMAISDGYYASHATKRYTGMRVAGMPDDLWESKLYPGARITHGRKELEGEAYGKIVLSLRKA